MHCSSSVYSPLPPWQGEQCFKQALSLDSSHVPSLILYSTCCALDERFDEGEIFLEMATAKDPNNAVAWTVTGEQWSLHRYTCMRTHIAFWYCIRTSHVCLYLQHYTCVRTHTHSLFVYNNYIVDLYVHPCTIPIRWKIKLQMYLVSLPFPAFLPSAFTYTDSTYISYTVCVCVLQCMLLRLVLWAVWEGSLSEPLL